MRDYNAFWLGRRWIPGQLPDASFIFFSSVNPIFCNDSVCVFFCMSEQTECKNGTVRALPTTEFLHAVTVFVCFKIIFQQSADKKKKQKFRLGAAIFALRSNIGIFICAYVFHNMTHNFVFKYYLMFRLTDRKSVSSSDPLSYGNLKQKFRLGATIFALRSNIGIFICAFV